MERRTLTDRLLDAAHDYLPTRAQIWIEERAFNKSLLAAAEERLQRSTNPVTKAFLSPAVPNTPEWDAIIKSHAGSAITPDRTKTWLDLYTESARSLGPAAAAQKLHLSDLGEQWMRDLAKDQREPTYVLQSGFARDYDAGLRGVPDGQRELFSDRITPTREERAAVPIHHPTRTEAYRIERQYYDKHFPQTSQAQRDAGRLASAANVQDQTVIQAQQMLNLDRDKGMER